MSTLKLPLSRGKPVSTPRWLAPLLFLLASRVLLSLAALAASNLLPHSATLYGRDVVVLDPHTLPGVWMRYDAGYYVDIAVRGYTEYGKDTNFFPAFPLLMRALSLGAPTEQSAAAWGLGIANLAFVLGGLLFWELVREDWGVRAAWAALLSLTLFPTAFFFSAIYTESLFLLLSLLVYSLSCRRRYLLAGVVISLASLTRINGVLLALIPLVELLIEKPAGFWRKIAAVGVLSCLGLAGFMLYNGLAHGSPLAFVTAQTATMGRYIAAPWSVLADSVNVVVTGAGGNEANWFMRMVTLQDLLALGLFIGLAVLAFRWLRLSLAVYLAAALVFILLSHGPALFGVFSGARYVLVLFPGFIVLGLLLDKAGRIRWAAWALSGLLLLFLIAWWVTGHWVA